MHFLQFYADLNRKQSLLKQFEQLATISNTIFWKYVARPFRCIYVNCFYRIRFLAEVSIKLQKMHFFRQFFDHNSGRDMENRKMTLFFYLIFPLWLFVTFISEFENNSKFIFMWSPLLSILVCESLNFWAKATDSESSSYFSRKETPTLCFVYPPEPNTHCFRFQFMDYYINPF